MTLLFFIGQITLKCFVIIPNKKENIKVEGRTYAKYNQEISKTYFMLITRIIYRGNQILIFFGPLH